MLVSLADCASGTNGVRELVVRIERPGRNTFLGASIGRQAKFMARLNRSGIKVPAILGWEEDVALIGASFLVMDRVDAVSLPMHPSYYETGFLYELEEAQRHATWVDALGTIASINLLDWRDGCDFLIDPQYGPAGLGNYLGWIKAWRDEACDHKPNPIIDRAIEHLERNRPADGSIELLWGDSNPGNFMFARDGSVAAALDFEAAAIGPAEIDLSWWWFVGDMLAGGRPLPPGMPDRSEQIAIYEKALGRSVANLDYFAILAGVRMSLVMAQTIRNLIADDILPPTNQGALANPAIALLAGMIDMPVPTDMSEYMAMVMAMNQRG